MAGLFDGAGGAGGFDMESLMKMLNPIGSAEAATPAQPASGMNGLTPQALINSEAGRNPINGQAPFPTVPPAGQPYGVPPVPSVEPTRSIEPPLPRPALAQPQPGEPVLPAVNPTLDDLAVAEAVRPNGVGAALTGGTTGTSDATDIGAQKRTEPRRPSLSEALKGTAMPKAPEGQKISTPAAPRPTGTIKSGELMALLTALNAGGGGAGRVLGK